MKNYTFIYCSRRHRFSKTMKINAFINCPASDKGQNNLILPILRFTIKQDKADLISNLFESLITAERREMGFTKTRQGLG